MANPTTYGDAHLYGVSGSVSNATVTAFKSTQKNAIEDTTENESGVVVERRYDDLTTEADISLRIKTSYTVPTAGDTLVYETVTYEITEVARNQVQKGFRSVDLKLKKSQGITYS